MIGNLNTMVGLTLFLLFLTAATVEAFDLSNSTKDFMLQTLSASKITTDGTKTLSGEIEDDTFPERLIFSYQEVYVEFVRAENSVKNENANVKFSSYWNANHTATITLRKQATVTQDQASLTSFGALRGMFSSVTVDAAPDELGFKGAFVHEGDIYAFEGRQSSDEKDLKVVGHEADPENWDDGFAEIPDEVGRRLQAEEQWEDCYADEESTHVLSIGIAVTDRLISTWTKDLVEYEINSMVNSANIIYITQLNVRLVVGDIEYGYSAGKSDEKACTSMTDALTDFRKASKQSDQAIWHLLDDCLEYLDTSSGVTVGYAYIGSLCHSTYNVGTSIIYGSMSWKTLAHEIGHIFGATHSFENGIGTTGGIMDYGSGLYNGVYQFNPIRKDQICRVMTNVVEAGTCGDSLTVQGCEDSSPSGISFEGEGTDVPCEDLTDYCSYLSVISACPKTCGTCAQVDEGSVGTLPTSFPTTSAPTDFPTSFPTKKPSTEPTYKPTVYPTKEPTLTPTKKPTPVPTPHPTKAPSKTPTTFPTSFPTAYPSNEPTPVPTNHPSELIVMENRGDDDEDFTSGTDFPTMFPTPFPSSAPTPFPTNSN